MTPGAASSLPFAAPAASTAIALYARATPGFDERLEAALQLLRQGAQTHPGRIVQATSLGAEDMVITDLIARYHLPVAVATLETGMLHAETSALIGRIETHYGLPVEVFRPVEESVVAFVAQHGALPMYDSFELRKSCCGIRKVEPLGRMLAGRDAWVTGMRRDQSANRGTVGSREIDGQGRTKLSPLVDWTWADVWHYIAEHDVPYNALHDAFMPSIGCAPCTRAIAVGEDFRAGRWWWEAEGAKECGLHVHDDAHTAAEELSPLGEHP